MKRNILTLTLLFLTYLLYSQSDTTKEGYYQTLKEYKEDSPRNSGELVSASSTDIVFRFSYSTVKYNAKLIWGYRDRKGVNYKAINGQFYRITNNDGIIVYECNSELPECVNLISSGISGFPLEMNPDNVLSLLIDNEQLVKEYKALAPKEKKTKALNFILSYNASLRTK